MKHCIECGTELIVKELAGEGMIPYCEVCKQHRFPMYNVAVSVIILNQKRDKVLLIQQYGKKRNILVAGYVNKGEAAEHAVKREIMEEVGLEGEVDRAAWFSLDEGQHQIAQGSLAERFLLSYFKRKETLRA